MKNFTPAQVRAMSFHECVAAIDGFMEFNGAGRKSEDESPITAEEIAALELEVANYRKPEP